MGGPERDAYKALSAAGKKQYDLDKALEKQQRDGAYSIVRDKMIAGEYSHL